MTHPDPAFTSALAAMKTISTELTSNGYRISFDEYGLLLAQAVSLRADCTRRRVGAVIMDPQRRIVGTGYNGAPAGHPGCLTDKACPRGQQTYDEIPKDAPYAGNCIALHAEENALLHSGRSERTGSTIFITDQPCPNCSRILAGSGLSRMVWFDTETDTINTVSL